MFLSEFKCHDLIQILVFIGFMFYGSMIGTTSRGWYHNCLCPSVGGFVIDQLLSIIIRGLKYHNFNSMNDVMLSSYHYETNQINI